VPTIKRYEDLIAWQKAYALVLRVYRLTQDFPDDERFGLISQMRRCSVSIPSNIAEGFGRHATGDYLRFLAIALGSTYELQTQLRLAMDLSFHQDRLILDEVAEVERILNGLIRSLRNKHS
jgi:four helix bundle protein